MGKLADQLRQKVQEAKTLRGKLATGKEIQKEVKVAGEVAEKTVTAPAVAAKLSPPELLPAELSAIEKEAYTPYIAPTWAGGDFTKQTDDYLFGNLLGADTFVGGRPLSKGEPINTPSKDKLSTPQAFSEALTPSTVIGPITTEIATRNPFKPEERAKQILSDRALADSIKGKTPEEKANGVTQYAAMRAMVETLAKNAPELTDEELYASFLSEYEDLEGALAGTSTKRPAIVQEPGKPQSVAEGIISVPRTTPGKIPDLSGPQMAFYRTYLGGIRPAQTAKAKEELRAKLTAEDIIVFEGPPDELGGPATGISRKRRPDELNRDFQAGLPAVYESLATPFWADPVQKAKIIGDPSLVQSGNIVTGRTYYSGATAEGHGTHRLRQILAPLNIITTAIASGTGRLAERAALATLPAADRREVGSSFDTARSKRGDKGALIDEGFIGDLANSVMFNEDAAQVVRDNYAELDLPENAGFALGLGLSLLTPPLGGLVSGGVAATRGVSTARAIRAAGLLGESPLKAGVKEGAKAFRQAWTYNAGTAVAPGSLKILAAEDTAQALIIRQKLSVLQPDATVEEIMGIVNAHPGSLQKAFVAESKQAGGVERLFTDVIKPLDKIPEKGSFFSGSKALIKRSDDLLDNFKNYIDYTPLKTKVYKQDELIDTVIRNAAARSDKVLDAFKVVTDSKDANSALKAAYDADANAFREAASAVTAFDAYNKSTKALGWAEHADLVLVTPRYIATPKAAIELADDASQTGLGKLLSAVIKDKSVYLTNKSSLYKNTEQAIYLSKDESKELVKFLDAFIGSGFILKSDFSLKFIRPAKGAFITLADIRRLNDLNVERIISARGKGIDVRTLKTAKPEELVGARSAAVPNDEVFRLPNVIAEVSNRLSIGSQIAAKQNMFVPPEMRSVFDNMTSRARALLRPNAGINMAKLDMPVEIQRVFESAEEAIAGITVKLRVLFNDLKGENFKLRQEYGLSRSGQLTESDILTAVVRKTLASPDNNFVSSTVDIVFGAAKWDPVPGSYFKTLSWTSPNLELLSGEGTAALNLAKKKLKLRINAGNLKGGMDEFIKDTDIIKNNTKYWKKGEIPNTFLDIKQTDIPKLVGASLFDTTSKALSEEGILTTYYKTFGKNVNIEDYLAQLTNKEQIQPILEAFARQINNNTQAPLGQKLLEGFLKVLQTAGRIRYGAMLAARPAYHTMNIISGPALMHGTIGKNMPMPLDVALASKVVALNERPGLFKGVASINVPTPLDLLDPKLEMVRRVDGENTILFKDKFGKPYTARDVLNIGIRSGAFKTEQQVLFNLQNFDEVVKMTEKMGLPQGYWTNWKADIMEAGGNLTDFANATDNTYRTAALIKALRAGLPEDVGKTIGRRSLFDYGSIGEVEKAIVSRFLMFSSFARLQGEQLIKALGSTAGASRFVKQMAFAKDTNKFVYEAAGGEDYDTNRILTTDKNQMKYRWPANLKIGTSEAIRMTQASPYPQGDSFMQIVNLLYQASPTRMLSSPETGVAQFLAPEIQTFVKEMTERQKKTRKQKLKLVDPRHMLMWNMFPEFFESTFGPVKRLEPSDETSTTYNGAEWALVDPDGYDRYAYMERWAPAIGLKSVYDAYSPLFEGEGREVDVPIQGGESAKKLFGFGNQVVLTPSQAESGVLKRQSEELNLIQKGLIDQAVEKAITAWEVRNNKRMTPEQKLAILQQETARMDAQNARLP